MRSDSASRSSDLDGEGTRTYLLGAEHEARADCDSFAIPSPLGQLSSLVHSKLLRDPEAGRRALRIELTDWISKAGDDPAVVGSKDLYNRLLKATNTAAEQRDGLSPAEDRQQRNS